MKDHLGNLINDHNSYVVICKVLFFGDGFVSFDAFSASQLFQFVYCLYIVGKLC